MRPWKAADDYNLINYYDNDSSLFVVARMFVNNSRRIYTNHVFVLTTQIKQKITAKAMQSESKKKVTSMTQCVLYQIVRIFSQFHAYASLLVCSIVYYYY